MAPGGPAVPSGGAVSESSQDTQKTALRHGFQKWCVMDAAPPGGGSNEVARQLIPDRRSNVTISNLSFCTRGVSFQHAQI